MSYQQQRKWSREVGVKRDGNVGKRLSSSYLSTTQTYAYEIKPSATSVNGFVVVRSANLHDNVGDVVKVTVNRSGKWIKRRKGKARVVASFSADLSEVII